VVLADNVANLSLSYVGTDGLPTAVPGNIRAVAVSMTLVVTGHGTERTYASMGSRVAFRNIP
jgi:hypothetical protein